MSTSRSFGQRLSDFFSRLKPSFMFVVLIFGALFAFEIFNYSTTDHALQDLLGVLEFGTMKWSTILAIAFCGIDFAGIARLFTPEQGLAEPKEVWYLFGAWLLAATMNAILTWWGVSMAIVNHQVQSASIVDPKLITTIVPLFVAIMVWVIRILIIGTLSLAMDRLLHPDAVKVVNQRNSSYTGSQQSSNNSSSRTNNANQQTVLTPRASTYNSRGASASGQGYQRSSSDYNRGNNTAKAEPVSRGVPELEYHSLSMNPAQQNRVQADRQSNNTIRHT